MNVKEAPQAHVPDLRKNGPLGRAYPIAKAKNFVAVARKRRCPPDV
jgi:hypothetical protein